MAVRRTREEKVKAQQRRGEMFSWSGEAKIEEKSPKTSLSTQLTNTKTEKREKAISPESRYLKVDLLRTLLATLIIIALLAFAYWRS
jgi:hypothetical protein